MLSGAEIQALLLSLRVSAVAVLFALPFAVAAAMLLAQHRFAGKALIGGILHLPLVLPPVVVGYLLLILFGTRAPAGAWLLREFGLRLAFDWKGAALAAALMTFPFQLRAIRLSLENIDRGLGEAAATLGAGPLDRFFNIVLPLALPGVVVGLVTAFSASLGEFGAIITFVSNIPGETQTLPLAIYSAIQSPGGEAEAARLSLLSIALAAAGLAAAEWGNRRLRDREW